MDPIRVLVVDDETLMRRALVIFVDGAEDMTVVGEAADGVVALRQCAALRPDVVLMDMQMPEMNGIEATRAISDRFPETRVIAVTTFSSERYLVPALRAGASGYLVKDAEPEEFVAAVRGVHTGGYVLSSPVTRDLVLSIRESPDRPEAAPIPSAEELSPRELDVVALLGCGMSNAEVARELHLSEATVKTHLGRVMAKWGARDRVQVVIHAARTGVITLA